MPLIPSRAAQACLAVIASQVLAASVMAHGETDWNDFKVDNKNEAVATELAHARQVISDVVMGRRDITEWPDLDCCASAIG